MIKILILYSTKFSNLNSVGDELFILRVIVLRVIGEFNFVLGIFKNTCNLHTLRNKSAHAYMIVEPAEVFYGQLSAIIRLGGKFMVG